MVEPRLAPRLSVAARPKGRFRHLTRHGGSWRFQLRVPADLDPERKLGPVRCNLGPLPIRVAHRKARGLAAAAEVVFARARNRVRSEMPDRMIAEFCRDPVGFFEASGLMLTRGELFPNSEPPPDVQADIALVRDFAMFDRELGRAEPSPYVVENQDTLRREAASRAARARADFYATQLGATGVAASTSRPRRLERRSSFGSSCIHAGDPNLIDESAPGTFHPDECIGDPTCPTS